MKQVKIFSFLALFFFSSCNNSSSDKIKMTSDDGKTSITVDMTEAEKTGADMEKKIAELSKLSPLTTDQLKTLIPDELMGMKRSDFNVNSMMGFSVGEASYKSEDDKSLKVAIYDCAGSAGASFYSMNYFMKMSMQSESDDGYSKTVSFNGNNAIESFEKGMNEYSLTFLANDRLLVSVTGENTGLDMVKDAAKNLRFK